MLAGMSTDTFEHADAPTTAATTIVAVAGLHRRYGEGAAAVDALAGVDVAIHRGEFTAIMGASGSGKSTLMHLMAGLDTPTSGTVTLDGVRLDELDDRRLTELRRDKVGFIFQAFNLLPVLTAEENLVLPLTIAGRKADPAWLESLVAAVGLGDRRTHRPSEMSGGQQQRVAVARALVTKPAVVFADEPTGNLDSVASSDVLGAPAPRGRRLRPDRRHGDPRRRLGLLCRPPHRARRRAHRARRPGRHDRSGHRRDEGRGLMRQVALRGLRARPLRTILTAMSVVLGVAMISGTYVLTDTINKSFSEVFSQANSGTDVVVAPKKVDKAFDGGDLPPIDERLVARVQAADGVRVAAGAIRGDVTIRNARGTRIGSSQNLVLSLQPKPLDPFRFVSGRAPRAADELALSAKVFGDEHLKLGDTLTLTGHEGARPYTLVGSATFGDVDTVAGFPAAIVTLPTAQALTGDAGKVDTIAVAAADGVTPARLRASVGAALTGEQVEVRTGAQDAAQQTKDLEKSFGFVRTALLVFGAIALFVGAFVIYNTFTITVAQRTRELALLRTLGASRRQVLRSVVMEAAIIGLLASVLGLIGGLLLAPGLRGLLKIIGADLPATASVIAARTIVVSLVVGVVVTVIASIVPALRATRIAPIVALRDGLTAQTTVSRKRIVFAALLCLAGGGVLAYGLFGGASGTGAAATLGGGAVAVFLGVALFSPQLVRPLAWVVGAPLQRFGGVSGRLARENATRNPARTAVTAAALMVGVALVAFVSIFAAGLRGSIDGAVDRAFTGNLSIVDKSGFGNTPPALVGAVGRGAGRQGGQRRCASPWRRSAGRPGRRRSSGSIPPRSRRRTR